MGNLFQGLQGLSQVEAFLIQYDIVSNTNTNQEVPLLKETIKLRQLSKKTKPAKYLFKEDEDDNTRLTTLPKSDNNDVTTSVNSKIRLDKAQFQWWSTLNPNGNTEEGRDY